MKALCTVALQGLHWCCGSPSSEVMVDTTGRGDQRSTDGSYTRVAAPSPPVTTRYCSVPLDTCRVDIGHMQHHPL